MAKEEVVEGKIGENEDSDIVKRDGVVQAEEKQS